MQSTIYKSYTLGFWSEIIHFGSAAASSTFSWAVVGWHAPVTFHQPTSYTSDQAASHATITNGKVENERALFSAAAAFLGYDLFIQETGEIVPEMRVPTQRALEGFG